MERQATKLVIVGQVTYDEIWQGTQLPEADQVAWPDRGRSQTLGGMAANSAVVYRALGATELRVVTALGKDFEAQAVIEWLESAGISADFVVEDSLTRTAKAFIWVDTRTGRRLIFFDEGGLAKLSIRSVMNSGALTDADGLHLGGLGVLSGLEHSAAELFQKTKEVSTKVITSFDTCVPAFGRKPVDLKKLLPLTDLALTSLRESKLYTGESSAERVADWLLNHDAVVALVTKGKDGLLSKSRDDQKSTNLEAINPKEAFLGGETPPNSASIEKTGCGDAARAAFLWIYHRTRNNILAAMGANIVGARTTAGPGGTVGRLSWIQLNELGRKIYEKRWTEQL